MSSISPHLDHHCRASPAAHHLSSTQGELLESHLVPFDNQGGLWTLSVALPILLADQVLSAMQLCIQLCQQGHWAKMKKKDACLSKGSSHQCLPHLWFHWWLPSGLQADHPDHSRLLVWWSPKHIPRSLSVCDLQWQWLPWDGSQLPLYPTHASWPTWEKPIPEHCTILVAILDWRTWYLLPRPDEQGCEWQQYIESSCRRCVDGTWPPAAPGRAPHANR